ncbi:MAG: type II secretion system protein [Ignavibacteriales bacterium]
MFTNEKKELINLRQYDLRQNRNGFTLMELIIVITILAILVTLAILYYGNVTDSAYRDALLADLDATSKAIALYEKEYNSLPMVETAPIDLDTALTSNNVPDILSVSGLVTGYTVDRANANLLNSIKKTAFLFKGNDGGNSRGAGMLYYVDTANVVDSGTTVASGATSIDLADAGRADDYYNDCIISIITGTGAGQSRTITNFVGGATDSATVSSAWVTNPGAGSTYEIRPPVKKGDLIFVQSAITDRLIIKDVSGNPIYK